MVAEALHVVQPPIFAVVEICGAPPQIAMAPQAFVSGVQTGKEDDREEDRLCGAEPRRLAPPPLRRQNASRLSWPPDPRQEWCYICLPPVALAEQVERVLSRPTSARDVAEFFCSPEAAESRAYATYAARYHAEIHALLSR